MNKTPQWQKMEAGYQPVSAYTINAPDFLGMINSTTPVNSVINRASQMNQQEYQRVLPENQYSPLDTGLSSVNQVINTTGSTNEYLGNGNTPSAFVGSPNQIQQAAYNRLRTKLNHRDAMAVMGNIGAETGWQDKYFFGNHQDGSKRAYGAFSWQGGRETRLLDNLRSQGLLDANGNVKKGVDAVNANIDHILWELDNNEKGSWNRYQRGNYSNILEASRGLNNTVVRSSKDAKVLAGREIKYQEMMKQADLFERQYNQMNQANNNPNGNGGSNSNYSYKHLDDSYGVKNLSGVDPRLSAFADEIASYGFKFKITEGMRTQDRQNQLYNQGKSLTLNSKHSKGRAMDIMLFDDKGKGTWDKKYYDNFYNELNSRGLLVKHGIKWGGNFKDKKGRPFYDGVHYELI